MEIILLLINTVVYSDIGCQLSVLWWYKAARFIICERWALFRRVLNQAYIRLIYSVYSWSIITLPIGTRAVVVACGFERDSRR